MAYLYLKALHIIFVVTWFAGLFYIVRLFIYQVEASLKAEPDRTILVREYKRNTRRLWFGIAWPSAILTLILGTSLLYLHPSYLKAPFMHMKLGFVFLLYVYQILCHRIYIQLQRDEYRFSSQQLRIWNEVATLLLFAIVFIIILRNTVDAFWGIAGLAGLALILYIAIVSYKKMRQKNEKTPYS